MGKMIDGVIHSAVQESRIHTIMSEIERYNLEGIISIEIKKLSDSPFSGTI